MRIDIADNADAHRYEARTEDGTVAGFISYEIRGELLAMVHTQVEDAFEGHGVGSSLVKGALAMVRGSGLGLLPYCPFVAEYLKRYPEYQGLVPEARRTEFGLPGLGGRS